MLKYVKEFDMVISKRRVFFNKKGDLMAEKVIKQNKIYPNIDMIKTGQLLKQMIEQAGYTPKDIQNFLHLSCPQPIYRWYKGLILPSVDHLLMLSELLGVHMEEMLVKKLPKEITCVVDYVNVQRSTTYLLMYYRKLNKIAA